MFKNSKFQKIITILFLIIFSVTAVTMADGSVKVAQASDSYRFIVLSSYNKQVNIGDSFYITGICSDGSFVKWKSSNSRVASVNTYGQVTAKKAGSCKITAKVTGAEASCHVIVRKTEITLSTTSVSMENGRMIQLGARTSNGSLVTWKSSKKSVATIDEDGNVEAKKPGTTTITASADGTKKTCKVTVRKPTITLEKTRVEIYRGQTYQLAPSISSNRVPSYTSQKNSVASVDENGLVTAYKHGTANIRIKVDGITKVCTIVVKSPEIILSATGLSLKKGDTAVIRAKVSSGNKARFSSSKSSVASVDENGKITALKKGTCYIYAQEDGTKVSCKVTVKNKN